MKQGWQIKRLGEICDILNGFAFKSNEYVKEGVRVIRITNVQKGKIVDEEPKYFPVKRSNEILKYILQDGDLLMSLTGNVGRVGIISSSLLPAALNQRVACLRIKDKTISIKYLFHLLNSNLFEKDCISSASGIAQLNMSTKWLEQYEMVIPPPSEQQRIVNLLDAECAKIDALKANAEKNLQNAKDLFQAALKKELEPKEGWETKKVDDVSILITKGASPKWQGIEYVKDNGILFITSENVREGYLLLSPMKYVESKFNQKQKRSVLKKNDVLVNIVGASIGRAAVFDMDIDNANINQAVALVRCNQEEILPKYLCLFLNSSIANDMYGLMKKDTARANLSLENISDITLPVPSLKDQDCLIDLLDELDDKCKLLQANYEKTLSLCDDLKQALLRKAFNGEI